MERNWLLNQVATLNGLCLEWVEVDLDRAKKSLERNRKEVVREVERENEVDLENEKDRDHVIEKIAKTAIGEAVVEIGKELFM